MKYGIVTSKGTAKQYVQLAVEAEQCGWDGAFVWDDISVGPTDVFDPWVLLGAIASHTERITLGAMVFSLARRRPWKVARETLTLDHLCDGRLVIPVGLGGEWDGGYSRVNTDDPDRKIRAQKLDECLDILQRAWTGEAFDYTGAHYQATNLRFLPKPVQQPRIPIWAVGAWPYEKSLGRTAKLDGIIASDKSKDNPEGELTASAIRNIKQWITDHRESTSPFDIITEGQSSGTDHAANQDQIGPWQEAGATWFIESRWEETDTFESLLERVRQGPPRV